MLVLRKAILTPTARASILVATPNVRRVLVEKDEIVVSSSSKDS